MRFLLIAGIGLTAALFSAGQTPLVAIDDDVTGATSALTEDNPFSLFITGGTNSSAVTYYEDSGGGYGSAISAGNTDDAGSFKLCGILPNTPATIAQKWYATAEAGPCYGLSCFAAGPLNFTRSYPSGTKVSIRDNQIQMDPTSMVYSCGPLRSSSVLLIGHTQTFKIVNAAASSTVTYTENGTGPFTAGTTDSSGNFSLANVTVPDSPTSSISQVWKVGSTTLSPNPLVYSRRYPIVADGDSRVASYYCGSPCVITPRPYPQALSSAANLGVMGAHSGDVIASHLSTADSYNSSDGTKGHTNSSSRWYVLWIGGNDLLAANDSPATNCLNYLGSSVTCTLSVLEKNVQTIVADQQTAGFQVMVLNLPLDSYSYVGTTGMHTDRDSFNTWLATQSNFGGDAPVCDVKTTLGTSPNSNFGPDGLHLTQAGYDAVAAKVKSCLGW